ncbi:hypothetical protein GCM10023206_22600 [Acinetobacter puyangensis]|uniref:Pentapeptide MXKDX repeat protein n=1 Tax=Acinetobacter puyangensis TaxID=1096779 RepID=A0A240EB67_9GAMM|nr:hypothetical protein [Acinetobacter puyangensis]SNX45934.1 hypothetical protein SAMN05421731_10721 [Acinetobacter puyangensis]
MIYKAILTTSIALAGLTTAYAHEDKKAHSHDTHAGQHEHAAHTDHKQSSNKDNKNKDKPKAETKQTQK